MRKDKLGKFVKIKTGKLDANASSPDGIYPFFTCSKEPLKINSYSYDCSCVLVAGNGDLNVKYYEGKFDAYQRTYIIESIDESILDIRYLYWFLSKYVEKLRELSIGGVIKYIKLNNLTDPIISLPPLEDQKRIVKILDTADVLRQKRKQAIALLDDYLKSVFLEMFGGPVANSKKIKTYKGSDLFKFSSGKFNPTKNLSKDFKYPTYGGNGITGYSKDYLIDYDTLVIGRVGAYCGCVHKTNGKIWITDNAIFVKDFKQEVNLEFMNFQFKFLKFNKFADFSGQPKITQKPLDKIEYLVPPLEVQKRFDEIVKKTESLKQKMLIQSQELETQFQALMQKAFKGEL